MTKQPKGPRTKTRALDGPVKPGSPLYRALEMVAREIAKSLESNVSPKGKRQGKARL
jgi:hypothetical protein